MSEPGGGPTRSGPFDGGGDDDKFGTLAPRLAEHDGAADEAGDWPEALWDLLIGAGATSWSIPARLGGAGCDRPTLIRRYARVASGSLAAAFILTQHDAAARRLAASDTEAGRRWSAELAAGRAFATVGISQLTTSTRHGGRALAASPRAGERFRLDGAMPWVTAASRADVFVTGAVADDGLQLLIALPASRPGVVVRPPFPLAALQASMTAEVACEGVIVEAGDILAGPAAEVVAAPGMAGTGGLETSALALGLARAALDALGTFGPARADLDEPAEALGRAWDVGWADLIRAAEGREDVPAPAAIRGRANDLALRTTQAYLTARKGSGFVRTDPAQRWAREALFFLVWSCPSPVAQAAIRDLAGLCPA